MKKITQIGIAIFLLVFSAPAQSANKQITPDFFGMHIHYAAQSTPWPQVVFATWRLWDTHTVWPDLETEKGKWNFSALDKNIKLAEEHKVEVLLPLGLSPKWASSRPEENSAYKVPGLAAMPKFLSDWENYVRTVALRYRGRVSYYEIWNEPNLKEFFSGSVDDMIILTKSAYKVLKSIDPKIRIVSPAPTGKQGVKWMEQFLAKGGGDYVDIIGYHFYVTPDNPESMIPVIESVKNIMKKHSIEKPLWNTESGWDKRKTFTNNYDASGYVARSFIVSWISGVERYYWYAWDNKNWVGLRLTNDDAFTLTSAGLAFMQIQNWLIGHTIDSCDRKSDGIWTCSISDKATKIGEIIWSDANSKTLLRSQKSGYTVIEQLDGSAKLLTDNDKISITGSPIFLKVKGTERPPRTIKKNGEATTQTTSLIIQEAPVIIDNVPKVIK